MAIYENGMAPVTENVGYEESNIGKSFHNLSRVHQCQGIIGAEMPIDVIKTIPDDTFTDLEYYVNVVSRNPLSRDLRNGITVALHAYWSPCSELWEGWNNYITKGRSGKENLEVPKYYPYFKNRNDQEWSTTYVPCSPADYMGIPIAQYDNSITNKNYIFKAEKVNEANKINNIWTPTQTGANIMGKWGINALPLVMYNKIHRDYYMNQNLMQNNKNWFPVNDKDFILPYENTYVIEQQTYSNYVNCIGVRALELFYIDRDDQYYCDEEETCKPFLNKLHFRQFRGDYFTTASPFADLIRGDAEEIDQSIGTIGEFIYNNKDWTQGTPSVKAGDGLNIFGIDTNGKLVQSDFTDEKEQAPIKVLNKMLKTSPGLLSNIRKAIVLEKMMMRNGATNGTYREIIGAQFGYKPNQYDGKPRYLGGGTFNINFNSVIMQGSDTTTQSTGDKVSIAEGNGIIKIPQFHADDYGYIMIIATIIPDVYYDRQGLETMWTTTHQDQEYFPIKNNLAPRPILNKELWLGKEEENSDVFGYTEYASDLRSRQNIATGLCAVGEKSIWDSSTIMHRKFNTKPQLNNKMLTMYPDNIDLTPFYDANEIPFDMLIGCKVGAMRKIPYSSKPADLGIKY